MEGVPCGGGGWGCLGVFVVVVIGGVRPKSAFFGSWVVAVFAVMIITVGVIGF